MANVFPGCNVSFGSNGADSRSYRVSFDKAAERLPGFYCEWDVAKGARQFHRLAVKFQLRRFGQQVQDVVTLAAFGLGQQTLPPPGPGRASGRPAPRR